MSFVQGCLDCPMLVEVETEGAERMECGGDGHALESDIDLATTVCAGCPMAGKTLAWPARVKRQATSPLDDPRMNGDMWIQVSDITTEMRSAWPLWERFDSRALFGPDDRFPTVGELRPLRLPGMNARGEIDADDMTPEHFERVRAWQWKWRHGWRDMGPGGDIAVVAAGETWRPAILAQLDEVTDAAQ